MSGVHLIRDLLPRISGYGRYTSGNYCGHCLVVSVQGVDVYFSYNTIVAFRTARCGLVVHQNDWTHTTGKHLNWICDDKKRRVNDEKFEQLWREFVAKEPPKEITSTLLSRGPTTPVRRALLRRKPSTTSVVAVK